MKNKKVLFISISLFLASFIILIFSLKNLNSYSTPLDQIHFYTFLEDGNANHIINIEFNENENEYFGKLFIPGNYDKSVRLFWKTENGKQITINNNKSGDYQFSDNPFSFELLINNEKIYVNIELFRTSINIEPLFINIEEPLGLIDDMNNDSKHNTSCYGEATFNSNTYHMSIKGRGNATWTDCIKKPYNITFLDGNYQKNQSVSMIDGIETNKWSMLANYDDPTLLRNKIGYDLANNMGIGIDSKFYDVWMNGNYLGNYLITPKNDYAATKEGYIIEIDNYLDNNDPQFHISNNGEEVESLTFTVKNNNAKVAVEKIQDYMQKTWDAIKDYDSDEYLKYIDIDSWAKMYLLHEINKNFDVVCGSILMHRDGQDEKDKLIAGPIWDLDCALGTLSPNPDNGLDDETMFSGGYWYISSVDWIHGEYCFLQELGKHEDFLEKVKEVYYEYRELIIDLSNQINILSTEGYNSYLADFEKWGNDRTLHDFYTNYDWNYDSKYPIYYQTTNTYDDYVQNLIKYVEARIFFIDTNINDIK